MLEQSCFMYQTAVLQCVIAMLLVSSVLSQDQKDWIDPHDMEKFDSRKVERQFSKEERGEVKAQQVPCPKIINECENKLVICKEENDKLQLESQSCVIQPVEMPYFRQFVQVLINYMDLKKFLPDDETLHYQMHVKLTAAQLKLLKAYVLKSGTVQDASSVLGEMIQDVKIVSHTEEPWVTREEVTAYLVMALQVVSIVFLAVGSLKVFYTLSVSGMRLMILLSIFISVPWNWVHLYKVAVAKRMSEAMKDIPEACRPRDLTWQHNLFEWLKSSFTFQDDECALYHENLLVDPLWEVTPTKAVAVTLTKFFLEPVEYIAQAISKFFRGLLHDLPAQLWPVVLGIVVLFLLVFMVLTLIMKNGYRLGFPFGLLRLEPTGIPDSAAAQALWREQKQMIEDLQSALQKLQPANIRAITVNKETKEKMAIAAYDQNTTKNTTKDSIVSQEENLESESSSPVETVGNIKEADS
ncbi:chloride channel CLIC-like protein 1 [Lingula anatina]|uniref:Chloride channel CLIC-like protein 1 n=1 Tax=Lingula anatina TaxID=7574 RepID=A0A1S3K2L8_LINAN|nr:chloride channel CLIC-like protein 1 [Lingula anatina]|eukprot:XP_013416639.1 chloride channel CLIC-like protein 1 [Lingula anatina]